MSRRQGARKAVDTGLSSEVVFAAYLEQI